MGHHSKRAGASKCLSKSPARQALIFHKKRAATCASDCGTRSSLELTSGRRLLQTAASRNNFRHGIILSANGRARKASQQSDLPHVRQGVRYGALKNLLRTIPERPGSLLPRGRPRSRQCVEEMGVPDPVRQPSWASLPLRFATAVRAGREYTTATGTRED